MTCHHPHLVLANVLERTLGDGEGVLVVLLHEPVPVGGLVDWLTILVPLQLSRGVVRLTAEHRLRSVQNAQRGRELGEGRVLLLLALGQHGDGAGTETLSALVERLARVRAGVLGEDFGDMQRVLVAVVAILEVGRVLYFTVIVQPDHVELIRTGDVAGDGYLGAVLEVAGLGVLVDDWGLYDAALLLSGSSRRARSLCGGKKFDD